MKPVIVFVLLALPIFAQQTPESRLRTALQTKTGAVTLPTGIIEISREITLPADAYDLNITATNTTIKAASTFRGRALLIIPAGKNIAIRDLSLDGNRVAFPEALGPPPPTAMLSRVVANNGIIAEGVASLEITGLKATEVAGFPILVNGGHNIHIRDAVITDSGTLDPAGHNNGTGGLAIEEGASDFEVTGSKRSSAKVRGNGIWIRSATSSGTATSTAT